MLEISYEYDQHGKPVQAKVGGEVIDLSEEVSSRTPWKDFSNHEARSVTTTIKSTVGDMKDSYDPSEGSIIVRMEATHGGYFNRNWYNYLADGMKESVGTWLMAGGKPYVTNHDIHTDPLGRVAGAEFVDTGASTGFHQLDVNVGDEDEIERIVDGRSLTVSVGSKHVDKVECSICGHDLAGEGPTPRRYELESEPDLSWMKQIADAPIAKMLEITNEDYWGIEEDDEEGVWTARCRHSRGASAPVGGSETQKLGWFLHEQDYKEVSRVNAPADVNEETGEFAHIKSILEEGQSDAISKDLAHQLVEQKLSEVKRGSVGRARYSVAKAEDLWRPKNEDLGRIAKKAGASDLFFDRGLWIACQREDQTQLEAVQQYVGRGGRLVGGLSDAKESPDATDALGEESAVADEKEDGDSLSIDEGMNLPPRAFGTWLRTEDFTAAERRLLDARYTSKLVAKN